MKMINLVCKQCKNSFDYTMKEYNRQTKKFNRSHNSFFCSISCAMRWKNANRSKETQYKISEKQSLRLKGNCYGKKGNFTYYLNKARSRDANTNLTDDYLQNLWNNSEGKCKLTGIPINLKKGKHVLTTASLDRIDSNIGYVKDNVQFVCYGINLAKNAFLNEEMIEFIKLLRNN